MINYNKKINMKVRASIAYITTVFPLIIFSLIRLDRIESILILSCVFYGLLLVWWVAGAADD